MVVFLITNVIYLIFGSGEEQWWNKYSERRSREDIEIAQREKAREAETNGIYTTTQ